MTDTTPIDRTRSAASEAGRVVRPQRAGRKTTKAGKTATSPSAADPGATKTPTKLNQVIGLLARPQGASIDELCAATGWQAHSVRGAMAGALKKKGHVITSEKQDGVRRYRTAAGT